MSADLRVSDNQLVILVQALEASGKNRSINMNWELAALRELQANRRGEFIGFVL